MRLKQLHLSTGLTSSMVVGSIGDSLTGVVDIGSLLSIQGSAAELIGSVSVHFPAPPMFLLILHGLPDELDAI